MKWPGNWSMMDKINWAHKVKPKCPECGTGQAFFHGAGMKCRHCNHQFEVDLEFIEKEDVCEASHGRSTT